MMFGELPIRMLLLTGCWGAPSIPLMMPPAPLIGPPQLGPWGPMGPPGIIMPGWRGGPTEALDQLVLGMLWVPTGTFMGPPGPPWNILGLCCCCWGKGL